MITIKKIKPLFNSIITTCNKYPKDYKSGSIINASKADTIKEYQTVLAVGPMVRNIEVGDVVIINPKRYAVTKHKEGSLKDGVITDNPVIGYNFKIIDVDGVPQMYLQDCDIEYVVEIEEFDENPTIITEVNNKLILD